MALLKRLRDERGAVVVEFAIVFPIVMLIVFAVIDLSRFFFTLSNLSAAVREGARYAAVLETPESAASTTAIKQRVMDSFQPFASPGLDPDEISVNVSAEQITVRVDDYDFSLLTPFPFVVTMPDRQAIFRWERAP